MYKTPPNQKKWDLRILPRPPKDLQKPKRVQTLADSPVKGPPFCPAELVASSRFMVLLGEWGYPHSSSKKISRKATTSSDPFSWFEREPRRKARRILSQEAQTMEQGSFKGYIHRPPGLKGHPRNQLVPVMF